jgi:hypothetical protein
MSHTGARLLDVEVMEMNQCLPLTSQVTPYLRRARWSALNSTELEAKSSLVRSLHDVIIGAIIMARSAIGSTFSRISTGLLR